VLFSPSVVAILPLSDRKSYLYLEASGMETGEEARPIKNTLAFLD
jgi:hypothetical protein